MSATPAKTPLRRATILDIKAHKGVVPIVALTAYTAPMARLLDPHCDLLLVGDSLGMVLYAMESTLPVTLDMMIAHGKAVVASSQHACVTVDLPFGSYQASPTAAFDASARALKETGCQAVKLEGGAAMEETIAFLTGRGVPVMGHIALTPQSVHALGGYRYQGRNETERAALMRDALAVEKAGAFSVVLEGVEESLAREITGALSIPTIGIGASAGCDGQVLVTHDMLNLTPVQPRFAKPFGDAAAVISQAVEQYAKEVRARQFPTMAQCYVKKEAL